MNKLYKNEQDFGTSVGLKASVQSSSVDFKKTHVYGTGSFNKKKRKVIFLNLVKLWEFIF